MNWSEPVGAWRPGSGVGAARTVCDAGFVSEDVVKPAPAPGAAQAEAGRAGTSRNVA